MENTQLLVLFIALMITIYLIVRAQPKLLASNVGQYLSFLTPLMTGAALLFQLYSGYTTQQRDEINVTIDTNQRCWLPVLEYFKNNKTTTQMLYREVFPEEAALLNGTATIHDTP